VQHAFSDAASIAPPINNSGELTVLVDDVKITHLKYPFPTFDPFMIYEQVPLLSVREIAATKAYTIGRFYLPSSVYLKPFARTIRKWIIVWISAHTRSCAICRGAYKERDLYFHLIAATRHAHRHYRCRGEEVRL
jgi:hypothetical protein